MIRLLLLFKILFQDVLVLTVITYLLTILWVYTSRMEVLLGVAQTLPIRNQSGRHLNIQFYWTQSF